MCVSLLRPRKITYASLYDFIWEDGGKGAGDKLVIALSILSTRLMLCSHHLTLVSKNGKTLGDGQTVASQGSKSPSHHIQGLRIAINVGIRHLGFSSNSQSQLLDELWGKLELVYSFISPFF